MPTSLLAADASAAPDLLGGKPTYINEAEGRNLAGRVRDGSRTWEYLSRIVNLEAG